MYQALVVNCICIGWNTFLSYASHNHLFPSLIAPVDDEPLRVEGASESNGSASQTRAPTQ